MRAAVLGIRAIAIPWELDYIAVPPGALAVGMDLRALQRKVQRGVREGRENGSKIRNPEDPVSISKTGVPHFGVPRVRSLPLLCRRPGFRVS
jgi:hypothetical protein